MDGNFVSTDIRYRDRVKSRRRSTSCSTGVVNRSGGARSRSVGGRSIGGAIMEEVGGGANIISGGGGNDAAILDEVFEDAVEVSGGGDGGGGEEIVGGLEVSSAEGAVGGVSGGVENGGDEVEVMDTGDVGGEVGANTTTVEEVMIPIGDIDVVEATNNDNEVFNSTMEDGGGAKGGEGDGLGGDIGACGGMEGNMNNSVGGGDGFGGDRNEGGGNIGDNGSPVEPIPLIPRWRLREILAHAEGECICNMVQVLLLCVYRTRKMLRVLGQLLPIGK